MQSNPAPASTDVLVLAAHAVELEGLSPALRDGAETGATRIACVGVGMTAAGSGAARAIAQHNPRRVVLIGSYGRYSTSALPCIPSEARVVERLKLIDPSVLDGKAAFPSPMPVELALDRGLAAALERAGARRLSVLGTTLSITTHDATSRTLSQRSGADGENLEALVVAQACADAGVPCAVLVACTNEVGPRGRADWLAHHAEAARATARLLEAFLCARDA